MMSVKFQENFVRNCHIWNFLCKVSLSTLGPPVLCLRVLHMHYGKLQISDVNFTGYVRFRFGIGEISENI